MSPRDPAGPLSSVITVTRGQRFNALMTIQVPLSQALPREPSDPSLSDWSMVFSMDKCEMDEDFYTEQDTFRGVDFAEPVGHSSAARVSRGSEFDVWPGLCVQSPVRHPSEHVTVTVVMYNVITGGVPSVQDVLAAIDDLEELYQACVVEGRLSESAMDFMKAPLTQNICPQINEKLQFQPPSIPVQNYDVFPM